MLVSAMARRGFGSGVLRHGRPRGLRRGRVLVEDRITVHARVITEPGARAGDTAATNSLKLFRFLIESLAREGRSVKEFRGERDEPQGAGLLAGSPVEERRFSAHIAHAENQGLNSFAEKLVFGGAALKALRYRLRFLCGL